MGTIDIAENIFAQQKWVRKVILRAYEASALQNVFVNLAVRSGVKLRAEASKYSNIADLVNLAFNYVDILFTITPVQVKQEISGLLKILAASKPKFVLEIGTARGGTLFLFTRVVSPDAVVISLDLPQGEGGGGYYSDWKIPFYESFAVHKQKVHLVRLNSHAASTLNAIKRILGDNLLDFLFLDGDHTYDGVKADFDMYSPLVRKGGLIVFHDICMESFANYTELEGGVNKFWNEIKRSYQHEEIISTPDQKGFGIGVLYT
ncbi:MAG: class I SAM-dependent methyltransferase [Candidatus Bathyarchaeia archaeon]|jgi:predicted O-methyltransferase YrrM